MKKILMTLALAAIVAIPSIKAQEVKAEQKTECNQACPNGKKECIDAKECNQNCKDCKDCKKECKKGFKKHSKGKKIKGNIHSKTGEYGSQNPLFNGINLSADQQQKFQALREKQAAEHKAARAEKKAAKSQQKAANAELRKMKAEAYDKEVEKILTPDQYKQYKANKESMKKTKKFERR